MKISFEEAEGDLMKLDSLYFAQIINRPLFFILTVFMSFSLQAEMSNQIEAPAKTSASPSPLVLSGLLELAFEASDQAEDDTEFSLATLELAGHVDLTPRLELDVLFAYDQDSDSLQFDTGVMTYQYEKQSSWIFSAGREYLPFGAFFSHQVNDTLSLELAEIRGVFSGASYQQAGFKAELYLYEEALGKHANLGGRIGFHHDVFQIEMDVIESVQDNPGLSVHGQIMLEKLVLIGEHLVIFNQADRVVGNRPSRVDQIELAYHFANIILAAAYQESDVLDEFELAKEKTSITLSSELNSAAHLGFEVARQDGSDSLTLLFSMAL